MRKTILLALIAVMVLSLVLFFSGVNSPQAKVTGECSNCHTMHNSQGGQPMTFDNSSTPNPALTRGSCVGCHSNSDSATIKSGNIPVVYNTSGGNQDPGGSQSWSGTNYNLAGGNFYYIVNLGSAYGHNVEGITDADSTLGNNPPGYNSSYDPSTVKYSNSYRLTCAGSNGCHGNRNVGRSSYSTGYEASFFAIRGAHHEDDSVIDGSTVGKSYRFLYGIKGIEDSDWQQSASTTDHNEYKGATAQNVSDTISYLCGNCHGDFHDSSGIGSSSPWLRHPTDTDVIGKGGEYANYGGSSHTYNLLAPVGYISTPSSPRETVSSGDSPVMCLSCHRAHASPNWKIMRWDYKSWPGSGTNGCNVCHTSKD